MMMKAVMKTTSLTLLPFWFSSSGAGDHTAKTLTELCYHFPNWLSNSQSTGILKLNAVFVNNVIGNKAAAVQKTKYYWLESVNFLFILTCGNFLNLSALWLNLWYLFWRIAPAIVHKGLLTFIRSLLSIFWDTLVSQLIEDISCTFLHFKTFTIRECYIST